MEMMNHCGGWMGAQEEQLPPTTLIIKKSINSYEKNHLIVPNETNCQCRPVDQSNSKNYIYSQQQDLLTKFGPKAQISVQRRMELSQSNAKQNVDVISQTPLIQVEVPPPVTAVTWPLKPALQCTFQRH